MSDDLKTVHIEELTLCTASLEGIWDYFFLKSDIQHSSHVARFHNRIRESLAACGTVEMTRSSVWMTVRLWQPHLSVDLLSDERRSAVQTKYICINRRETRPNPNNSSSARKRPTCSFYCIRSRLCPRHRRRHCRRCCVSYAVSFVFIVRNYIVDTEFTIFPRKEKK